MSPLPHLLAAPWQHPPGHNPDYLFVPPKVEHKSAPLNTGVVLRFGAPLFSAPLAQLFNQSVAADTVPRQCKAAMITPVPRVTKPSDFRPISINPVLSTAFERHIVRSYIYSALKEPPPELHFADQFTFRPTGSTAAAIIAFLHTVLVYQ